MIIKTLIVILLLLGELIGVVSLLMLTNNAAWQARTQEENRMKAQSLFKRESKKFPDNLTGSTIRMMTSFMLFEMLHSFTTIHEYF